MARGLKSSDYIAMIRALAPEIDGAGGAFWRRPGCRICGT